MFKLSGTVFNPLPIQMYGLPKADLWVWERDQKGDDEIPTDLFCQAAKKNAALSENKNEFLFAIHWIAG